MTHYYPKLGEILRGTNGGSKVVLNQHFVDWQERIEDHLKFRRRDKRYYHDDDNETALFRYAQEHQDHYGKALSGQEVLVLFFLIRCTTILRPAAFFWNKAWLMSCSLRCMMKALSIETRIYTH